MTHRVAALLLGLQLLLTACTATVSPAPSATPATSGTPGASSVPGPTGPLTQAQLKVRLIDRFGPLWYCDPDFFPVAREDEGALAIKAWPQVAADVEAVAAIRAQWGITRPDPTDPEKLAIYHEWKMLRAISLDPAGAGRWRFDYLPQPVTPSSTVTRTAGTIDEHGLIAVERTEPGRAPNCPICLARGSLIDTPAGPIAVEALRMGDPVWTLDGAGVRTTGTVIALGSTPVPAGHEVIQLRLADGRALVASPGHPLADGRRLGELVAGDRVDGSVIVAADRVPYAGGATFDLLASGASGAYAAGGIWLGSTLHRQ